MGPWGCQCRGANLPLSFPVQPPSPPPPSPPATATRAHTGAPTVSIQGNIAGMVLWKAFVCYVVWAERFECGEAMSLVLGKDKLALFVSFSFPSAP